MRQNLYMIMLVVLVVMMTSCSDKNDEPVIRSWETLNA